MSGPGVGDCKRRGKRTGFIPRLRWEGRICAFFENGFLCQGEKSEVNGVNKCVKSVPAKKQKNTRQKAAGRLVDRILRTNPTRHLCGILAGDHRPPPPPGGRGPRRGRPPPPPWDGGGPSEAPEDRVHPCAGKTGGKPPHWFVGMTPAASKPRARSGGGGAPEGGGP